MNEDRFNMDIRKYLKVVGVTSQRKIELAVRAALAKGTLAETSVLKPKNDIAYPRDRIRARDRRGDRVDVSRRRSTAVRLSEDGFVVEAELVAEKLGLSPDAFWREMKRGIVYGVVERGEGDDAGRTRLTFRYRARSWSVTLKDMAQ